MKNLTSNILFKKMKNFYLKYEQILKYKNKSNL